jgi:hypothetical protein
MSLYVPILELHPDRIRTIQDLETEIFKQIGLRIIIRLPKLHRIQQPRAVAKVLNECLDLRCDGLTVTHVRECLHKALFGNIQYGPRRERIVVRSDDVVVISNSGIAVNGNTLVENIRWHKDAK